MSKSQPTIYVGLDVHKAAISVSVVTAGKSAPKAQWQIAHEPRSIKRMVKRLREMTGGTVATAYEAGPCGYALQRRLLALGVACTVVAPSLIPVKPGERVKTDRRDALKIAQLFSAGLLTEVHPPTPEDESLRDLVRAREDVKQDQMRARHRLSKMLLRRSLHFTETKNWTKPHRAWLKRLRFDDAVSQRVFDGYLLTLEQAEERLYHITEHVKEASQDGRYAEQVGWLRCLRGIDTITAMTVLAELHDFRRFTNPRELMSYLGLTPSERSSSTRVRRGSITKTGNGHVRRVLVETAWNYRHRPSVSGAIKKRRQEQPAAVIAIADRAQERLHMRYFKLKEVYRKPHNVVTVAIARELTGFIWAVLHHRDGM